MLKTLKKYQKYRKAFYGINRGTFGFLMNKFKTNDIHKNISKSNLVSISPLEMKAVTSHNKIIKAIAINDAIGKAIIYPAILGFCPASQDEKAMINPASKALSANII